MPILHQIDPVAVALGPLKIHWYGLMYLLGFAVAWWLGRRRVRAGRLPGVDDNGFGDLMFYACWAWCWAGASATYCSTTSARS